MSPAALALLLPALLATAPAPPEARPLAAPAHEPEPREPAPPAEGGRTATAAASSLVLFQALGRPTLVTVSGRVVPARPAGPPRSLARLTVEVAFGGKVQRVVAGEGGLFQATFAENADRPHPIGQRPVRASAGGLSAEGRVQVVDDGAPLLLVIEADELAGVVARREPSAQAATPRALGALLRCILEGTQPLAGGLVVTGAPPERLGRLQAALSGGTYPFLGLQVQPHGQARTAEAALRAVLSSFPHPVVLLGDVAGRAPERFAALRREFPGRIVATYLRGSPPGATNPRYEDATLFTDPLVAADVAASRGLADQACVDRALAPPPEPSGAACPPCPCPVPSTSPTGEAVPLPAER